MAYTSIATNLTPARSPIWATQLENSHVFVGNPLDVGPYNDDPLAIYLRPIRHYRSRCHVYHERVKALSPNGAYNRSHTVTEMDHTLTTVTNRTSQLHLLPPKLIISDSREDDPIGKSVIRSSLSPGHSLTVETHESQPPEEFNVYLGHQPLPARLDTGHKWSNYFLYAISTQMSCKLSDDDISWARERDATFCHYLCCDNARHCGEKKIAVRLLCG